MDGPGHGARHRRSSQERLSGFASDPPEPGFEQDPTSRIHAPGGAFGWPLGGLSFQGIQLSKRSKRRACDLPRSEEHTSELQSPCNLVCRLLLEKKKKKNTHRTS